MRLIEKLIYAVFVDKNRVITVEDGCDIWSLPVDGRVFWDGSSTKRLVIQPQWIQLYALLVNGDLTHVLLEGKAGRGKSVFVRYMIIRMLEDPVIPNTATFAYAVKDSIEKYSIFWIEKTNALVNVIKRISKEPTYLFLDNVDSTLTMCGKLNIGLTSGDIEGLKDFRKTISHARHFGKSYAMLALDLKVMRLIFPALLTDDVQFRFDVLGGNPRLFLDHEPVNVEEYNEQLISQELQSCFTMFFGVTYNHLMETPEGLRTRWAMCLIAKRVQQRKECDSSFFLADFLTDSGQCRVRFASTFLRLVAGALESKNDATLRDALMKIVGSSGLGHAHEYLSHKAFLAGEPTTTTFGLNTSQDVVELPVGLYGRQVTLVRNIQDLTNLPLTAYGLPTISNFPAVDAILFPNLLQMTISDTHDVAVGKLSKIADVFKVPLKDLNLIFVVESVKKAWTFKFPVVQEINMFVTPRDVCTEEALLTR